MLLHKKSIDIFGKVVIFDHNCVKFYRNIHFNIMHRKLLCPEFFVKTGLKSSSYVGATKLQHYLPLRLSIVPRFLNLLKCNVNVFIQDINKYW